MAVTVRNPQWFGDVVRQASTLRGFATQADLAAMVAEMLRELRIKLRIV